MQFAAYVFFVFGALMIVPMAVMLARRQRVIACGVPVEAEVVAQDGVQRSAPVIRYYYEGREYVRRYWLSGKSTAPRPLFRPGAKLQILVLSAKPGRFAVPADTFLFIYCASTIIGGVVALVIGVMIWNGYILG